MDKYELKEKDCKDCKEEVAAPEGVERMETRKAYVPAVDVLDSESETVLYADMPGADESSIEIMLEKNVLTIRAKPDYPEYPGYDLVYSEYGVGDFERSFTLTDGIDREKIAASVKDGVLKVTLPKAAPAMRKISVGVAE